MELPFSIDQFLEIFEAYNGAIWPAQIIAYLLAAGALLLTVRRRPYTDRVVGGILAFFWIWMGAVYHLAFFSTINPAAYGFGALFIVQGVLFLAFGAIDPRLTFRLRRDRYGHAGGLLMLYALVVYPGLGVLLGHGYPQAPMFGVAPCPTAIFTFGLLLWTAGRVPGWLLVIPALWALIGTTAALQLGIREDLGLVVAGLLGVGMLLYRNRREGSAPHRPENTAAHEAMMPG